MAKDKKKKKKIQRIDCYGIAPKGVGKIGISYPVEQGIMRELGDLGKL